ncbi:hypothetical protein PUNSTDRAFT_135420 [Punctularia strigosozonata HHB-11173 SS5]|uniref:uncharacterized protein n=1 Tax=Punctularia strigosozonata (strain HHB-11173) TaxID=741275 RepID=UPI0004418048|nr:uncharacterized protein PUNSTDRAFT_135420 [Punctularia strigosozonata HHB-11173 SS5]EIN07897.1 hypothetical protein PUNSTDRAFT_135420 [Punctularia strigosozonata HHB-11173 SS5]
MAAQRLQNISHHLGVSGNSTEGLPTFDELPQFHEYKGCAWGIWGNEDQLGTVNLLSPDVVQRAAREEVQPINYLAQPLFGRKPASIKVLESRRGPWRQIPNRDDELNLNTQSGTQWDGLLHVGVLKHGVFYNNFQASLSPVGERTIRPDNMNDEALKLGIHNWAQHGICGRGVLLDLVGYYTGSGKPLPYDPWASHSITVAELEACAKAQGTEFRTGDILMIRMGFMEKWYAGSVEERNTLTTSKAFTGLERSDDMRRFLWNNHFAAVASDQPALEDVHIKTLERPSLHETLLGLWGMPIGKSG